MVDSAAAVEAYLSGYPAERQDTLRAVRGALLAAIPEPGERLSYGIPTLTVEGKSLVHYAGWKSHLAVYPVPEGDAELSEALAPHRGGKGTLTFAWDAVPLDLLTRIAAALLAERG